MSIKIKCAAPALANVFLERGFATSGLVLAIDFPYSFVTVVASVNFRGLPHSGLVLSLVGIVPNSFWKMIDCNRLTSGFRHQRGAAFFYDFWPVHLPPGELFFHGAPRLVGFLVHYAP